MADRKISGLVALTTPAAGDYLPIIDISEAAAVSKNKRITIEELLRGAPDGTAAAPSIAFESDGGNGLYLAATDTIGISTNGVSRATISTTAITSALPIALSGSTSGSVTLTPVAVAGTTTITLPATTGTVVTTGDSGTVTSTMIANGTIVDADINASAGIAYSKLAALTAGNILVGNATNVATSTAVTGDVTINSSGITAISSGVIIDSDVNASAAIAGTKISPDFGSQNVTTTGTSTAASFSPTSSTIPTNGFYLGAANQLNFATGGVNRITLTTAALTSTLVFRAPNGTAAAPSVSFTSSNGSGFYYTGTTNEIAATTGGVERQRWGANGLHTFNSAAHSGSALSTTAPAKIYSSTGTYTDTATLASGTVTHGPIVALDNPAIAATNTGVTYTNASTLYIDGAPTASTNVTITNPYALYVNTGVSYFGGNVGIGTSSPSQLLHVNGSGLANNWLVPSTTGYFYDSTGQNGIYIFGSTNGTTPNILSINTNGTERLRVDASGRVGIGTTSPATKLQVAGSGQQVLKIQDTGNTNGFDLGNNTTESFVSTADNKPITFYTNNLERAKIDSSGRWLLGTSNYSGNSAFVIKGGAAQNVGLVDVRYGTTRPTTADVQVSEIRFGSTDFTSNSAYANIQCVTDGVSSSDADIPGRLVFSVTADGASTPTEALRITNDRVICYNQPAPASFAAAATLTVADLKTGIIQYTGAAATLTLPTGTLTEAGFSGVYTNMAFQWSVINTGSGQATIGAGTNHTIVGRDTVGITTSAVFVTRRTAANTFVSYRIG